MPLRRTLSLVLIFAGILLCALVALRDLRGHQAQRSGRQVLEEQDRRSRSLRAGAPSAKENPGIDRASGKEPPAPAGYPAGEPIARIRIPSARIDSVVFAGSDTATLEKGPGHVPGTEIPGKETGRNNCVITAHRDSHFRNLGWLRKGHRIELETAAGTAVYSVASREIVDPSAVRVLRPTEKARLTLITCYPFNVIGPAPKRLVVVAEPLAR